MGNIFLLSYNHQFSTVFLPVTFIFESLFNIISWNIFHITYLIIHKGYKETWLQSPDLIQVIPACYSSWMSVTRFWQVMFIGTCYLKSNICWLIPLADRSLWSPCQCGQVSVSACWPREEWILPADYFRNHSPPPGQGLHVSPADCWAVIALGALLITD